MTGFRMSFFSAQIRRKRRICRFPNLLSKNISYLFLLERNCHFTCIIEGFAAQRAYFSRICTSQTRRRHQTTERKRHQSRIEQRSDQGTDQIPVLTAGFFLFSNAAAALVTALLLHVSSNRQSHAVSPERCCVEKNPGKSLASLLFPFSL